jgi:hypothetical protein
MARAEQLGRRRRRLALALADAPADAAHDGLDALEVGRRLEAGRLVGRRRSRPTRRWMVDVFLPPSASWARYRATSIGAAGSGLTVCASHQLVKSAQSLA